MIRHTIAAILLLSPIALAPACDQPSRICDLVCECEHCNDVVEDFSCEGISASQDFAEAYDCLDEWVAYADCFEAEGTCDEEEANYTTREPGSCGTTADSGLPCMNNTDCLNVGFEGARCENMTCVFNSCSDPDNPGIPCTSSSDCPSGEDRCSSEAEDYVKCVNDASDSPNAVGGISFEDFD